MGQNKFADDLTEDELRYRLMRKKISGREARILSYRASGRAIEEESAPINRELHWAPGEAGKKVVATPAKRRLDKILLLIEIAAVIGIIVMFIAGAQILTNLNREAAQSMVMPTLTPTPLIQAVVLPSGHTPPNESGAAAFNESEIPEHLRDMVESVTIAQTAIDFNEQIVRIRIPAINVDAPVIKGDDWESLKNGVGLNLYSVEPGKVGNVILSGHNDIFGEVFRYLDQLKPGNEIVLLTEKKTYTYTVEETQIVQPNQVEVLAHTEDPTITLISCYPYLVDTKRIVVKGRLQS